MKNRIELFNEVANGLKASYNKLRAANLDSGLAGTAAENVLVRWMAEWLPQRIGIRNGAVLSAKRGPTTQRDCILFDQVECPVYQRLGNSDLLPIEGVAGAVELNYGENTSYEKIGKDAAKLSEIADLREDRLQRIAVPLSHLPRTSSSATSTTEERITGLTLHLAFDGKPLLLIFAEDLSGTLVECSKRLATHNKSVGIRKSIDGLFVLRKGFALHLDREQPGWVTARQAGNRFGCCTSTEGNVLLRMQSIILKHLYLGAKVHPEGFDPYVSQGGQGELETKSAEIVSDSDYVSQTDDGTLVLRL